MTPTASSSPSAIPPAPPPNTSTDDYGRKIRAIDPLGAITQYTYRDAGSSCDACAAPGQPRQIISPEGRITEYTYDSKGRRLSETRAAGTPLAATTRFFYDLAGRLTRKTDPLGHSWNYTYDDRGRRLSETDPLGKVTRYTYDAVGNTRTRTLPGGTAWSMTYDAMNRPLTTTDPLGHTTQQSYDSGGRLSAITDPLGRVTSHQYNTRDERLLTVHPDGSTTQTSYDAAGNLTQRTDELGRVTQFLYDNRNRLVTLANPLGEQFDYAYDAAGRRIAEMLPGGLTRHQVYDSAGRLLETIIAQDTDHETSTCSGYDADGHRLTETDPLGNTTTYTYDALGRTRTVTSPLGHTTTYAYDAAGNRLRETRPDDRERTWSYDALGRVLSETDPAGETLQYTYTPSGQLASLTDTRGAVTTFAYDALDRPHTKFYPDQSSEQSSYDAAGQLTQFTTARDITRSYQYDTRGRLISVEYSDTTPAVSYTYNAAGERTRMSNAHASIESGYDGAGRLSSETHDLTGHPLGARSFSLSHNLDARLTRIDYPGSNAPQLAYAYTLRGQLASLTTAAFSASYTRRDDESILALNYSNGVRNTRSYNNEGHLTDTAYYLGEAALPFSRAAYTLNALGQRTALKRADGAGDTFTYDARDQLTAIGYDVPGADPVNPAPASATFAYDPMGNRTRLEDRHLPAVTYSANALNQYTAISGSGIPTYDPDGNLTRRDDQSLIWDAENRLIEIAPTLPAADATRVRYAYDPTGRRVRRTVHTYDGTTWSTTSDTHYTYWNWNVIETHTVSTENDPETRRYFWGEDLSGSFQGAGGVGGLLAQEYGSTRWFYHYDGNGNVTELTDNAGSTVASHRYTAFGQLRSSSGPAAEQNTYRFSTKPFDDVAACYYYGYRFYDPAMGRWLNRDPIQERGGVNLSVFVANSPIENWDYLGLACSWAVGRCTRNVSEFTAPSTFRLGNRVFTIPEIIRRAVDRTIPDHHNVKVVSYKGKNCTGAVEESIVRGFFADSSSSAIGNYAVSLIPFSGVSGWVSGHVGGDENPGACNLQCVSESRYNTVKNRITASANTRYHLTKFNCQQWASQQL